MTPAFPYASNHLNINDFKKACFLISELKSPRGGGYNFIYPTSDCAPKKSDYLPKKSEKRGNDVINGHEIESANYKQMVEIGCPQNTGLEEMPKMGPIE